METSPPDDPLRPPPHISRCLGPPMDSRTEFRSSIFYREPIFKNESSKSFDSIFSKQLQSRWLPAKYDPIWSWERPFAGSAQGNPNETQIRSHHETTASFRSEKGLSFSLMKN